MALNFPSSPTAGDTYTDPNAVMWKYDGVKWFVIIGTTNRLFNGVKVYTDANVTLTNTDVAIDWDVEEFDIGDYFSTADASKLYISDNGYFRIAGAAYTGPLGTGSSYTFKLRKNGTTVLATVSVAANQTVAYDEIVQLEAGDYLEVLASESTAVGTVLPGSLIEITRLGFTFGQGVSQGDSFSGVKTALSANVSMTSTPTAVIWTTPPYDANANANGDTYWSVGTPTRLTIKTAGYYRIKSNIVTGTSGTEDSYTFAIKKNISTTLATIDAGPVQTVTMDETFIFSINDYIELFADNSGSVGTMLSSSFIEITRIGV